MANPIKLKAKIASIKPFGEGVFSIKIAPDGRIPRFQPGQFLHLSIDPYDPTGGFWPESRVFSIASAPDAKELEIVYSVKGSYTKRMAEELTPGREVWLKLPYGTFIINSMIDPRQDVVLVAGGTGLSPFMPYLEMLLAAGKAERVVRLYYGTREASFIFSMDLLESCVATGVLDARIFVENKLSDVAVPVGLKHEQGRLDIDRIHNECSGLKDPVVFLSGPPQMIIDFRDNLVGAGVNAGNIKIDEWE